MYIQSLKVHNLRCFADIAIDFQYPGRPDGAPLLPNINLLLGNNGAGKTTTLRAIALALLAPAIEGSGFVSYHLVRRTAAGFAERADMHARVLLHAQDIGAKSRDTAQSVEIEAQIQRIYDNEKLRAAPVESYWKSMYDDSSPAFFVIGYGASRRVESAQTYDEGSRRRTRGLRYQRIAGLFEETVTLAPLNTWLPLVEKEAPRRYQEVKNLINELLPEECRFSGRQEDGEYLFEYQDIPVPYSALSDGYRAYIGWVTDLLYHLVNLKIGKGDRLNQQRGIVLLDEVDLHLHPEWQRMVVPRLARALPALQFFLTTHSPIVAGTVASQSILLAEFTDEREAVLRTLTEQIHGLSAEQILLSSYFNLATTRAEDTETELQRLERRVRAGDREASLEYMRMLSRGHKE